jgi:hypothetical protein
MLQNKSHQRVKYPHEELNIDKRFFEITQRFNQNGLEFVLVKGIVWNRGRLLDGADLDFYVRENEQFKDYCEIPLKLKEDLESQFQGVLISPRETDFNIDERTQRFYVDAELVLNQNYANLLFANSESRDFFEKGVYSVPDGFIPSDFTVRFVLNRFLEETGFDRTLSLQAYEKLADYVRCSEKEIYKKMLDSFSKEDGLYHPPQFLPYTQLVLDHLHMGRPREDLIFIKPLVSSPNLG